MQKFKLITRDGALVHYSELSPHMVPPGVIIWQMRAFAYKQMDEAGDWIYTETFMVHVA